MARLRSGPVFLSEQMGRRQLTLTLSALMLCMFLSALDSSIVANALPRVIADLHGFELYAWVTTGYLLSSTAVVPIGGKLGDRYGRKPMLIGGAAFPGDDTAVRPRPEHAAAGCVTNAAGSWRRGADGDSVRRHGRTAHASRARPASAV